MQSDNGGGIVEHCALNHRLRVHLFENHSRDTIALFDRERLTRPVIHQHANTTMIAGRDHACADIDEMARRET